MTSTGTQRTPSLLLTRLSVHAQLDSAFQLQEHLAALHYYHTSSNTTPVTRATAVELATPPASIDRTLWLYELCRFLIAQCNSLIVGFLFDTPPCSAATCPEMRASEWQFLCAVHDQPRSCCAIDYCCHTLDWAANVVTNPKIFPSRFVALSEAHDRGAGLKNLVNVFRRLHRIFAHAWFQHRGVFWQVETQTGLYVFFKTVCDLYDLLPAENYKLPPEAEGLDGAGGLQDGSAGGNAAPGVSMSSTTNALGSGPERRSSLTTPTVSRPGASPLSPQPQQILQRGVGGSDQHVFRSEPGSLDVSGGDATDPRFANTNTRRHIRSNPSVGSAVARIPEADEEAEAESSQPTSKPAGVAVASSSSTEVPQQEPQSAVLSPENSGVAPPVSGPHISAGLASTIEVTNKLREMHIAEEEDDDDDEDESEADDLLQQGSGPIEGSAGGTTGEPEVAEVPVIVEQDVIDDVEKSRKQQQAASGKEESEPASVSAPKPDVKDAGGEGTKPTEDSQSPSSTSPSAAVAEPLLEVTSIYDFAEATEPEKQPISEPSKSEGTSTSAERAASPPPSPPAPGVPEAPETMPAAAETSK